MYLQQKRREEKLDWVRQIKQTQALAWAKKNLDRGDNETENQAAFCLFGLGQCYGLCKSSCESENRQTSLCCKRSD
jgi:hypothetical protein